MADFIKRKLPMKKTGTLRFASTSYMHSEQKLSVTFRDNEVDGYLRLELSIDEAKKLLKSWSDYIEHKNL